MYSFNLEFLNLFLFLNYSQSGNEGRNRAVVPENIQVCLAKIYGQSSIVKNTVCTTETHRAIFIQKGFYYLFIEHIIL